MRPNVAVVIRLWTLLRNDSKLRTSLVSKSVTGEFERILEDFYFRPNIARFSPSITKNGFCLNIRKVTNKSK